MTAQTVGGQHTPGPWETSRDAAPDWHTQVTVYAEADGERVATVFRNESNARLIAAAPQLLEALEEMMREYEPVHMRERDAEDDPDAVILARTVLAQVKGEDR